MQNQQLTVRPEITFVVRPEIDPLRIARLGRPHIQRIRPSLWVVRVQLDVRVPGSEWTEPFVDWREAVRFALDKRWLAKLARTMLG